MSGSVSNIMKEASQQGTISKEEKPLLKNLSMPEPPPMASNSNSKPGKNPINKKPRPCSLSIPTQNISS
jgi:hypothetical protein